MLFAAVMPLLAQEVQNPKTIMGWPAPLSNDASWKLLPPPVEGFGQELPSWIRILAREMPKTAAAFLELDYTQRSAGPVDPKLRAAMRWVSANENGSEYAKAVAASDAVRAGMPLTQWNEFASGKLAYWSERDQAAIEFARAMTLDSANYPDDKFAELAKQFGDRAVAAMVLHQAYANFQDRLLICLGAPLDKSELLPPVPVRFSPDSLVSKTTPPAARPTNIPAAQEKVAEDIVVDESPNTWLPYEKLQESIQWQRARKTRLRVPDWQEFASKLPKGLMDKASDIVWYKIAFGYADELAVPFEIYLRTAGSEISTNWDRLFGNCLFWMVTDAMKCPYCMGHCEMNWEVAGLSSNQIATISDSLAGSDWSRFSQPEQRALAFARKLTKSPKLIAPSDLAQLREDFGDQRALFMAVNTSRYNYMTRISNGFQLTLESGNPFYEYYRMSPPEKADVATAPRPTPLTRPEMKQLLEDMKQRRERISLPPLTEAEKSGDARTTGYEARLNQLFLPTTAGARGYLNFSGSAARTNANANATNRNPPEPDPALTLDYPFKTRLFWIASRANNCQYCLGHQESKLLAAGMNEDDVARLDSDWSEFPASEQAAFALARRLTLEPQRLTDADIDACRKHYTDSQILEMVLSVAGNNAINRWKEGVAVPQSSGGGNFGGATTASHSYLTPTSESFERIASKVILPTTGNDNVLTVPTTLDPSRIAALEPIAKGLASATQRSPRLPVASAERADELFSELKIPKPAPQWIRVLANYPIAGKRQLVAFLAAERELDLSDLTRARLAWVIARQNGAWYSLGEAQSRLKKLGQTDEQIESLDKFESARDSILTSRDKALLTVAKNLAASPVILTDKEVDHAVQLASPREVVQTVHYAAMRSLFDRFTEAAALPIDKD
jgi:alkylhydroperoxidase family enzyme